MRFIYFCFLSLIIFSCKDEDISSVELNPKPSGKYLSQIKVDGYPWVFKKDTIKYADFLYDDKRYLKRVQFYNLKTQLPESFNLFYYNVFGKIIKINFYDADSNLIGNESFIYENNHIKWNESYTMKSGILNLQYKNKFITNSIGRIIEVFRCYWSNHKFVESEFSTKYYYDSNGNILMNHYSGGTYEFINEYEYDDKINPFYNLEIPFSDNAISGFQPIDYLPANNITNYKQTFIDYTNYKDTIISQYINNHRYKYENNYMIEKNNTYFFEYSDL